MNTSSPILLVQPSWSAVHGSFADVATKKLFLPPVGLCYLAGALSREGFNVQLLDFEPMGLSLEEELLRVSEVSPFLLGVTATTPSFPFVKRWCSEVKKRFPNLPIVLGGPHVTGTNGDELAFPFDYALLGESELSLPLLARALRDRVAPDTVPGLVWREGEMLRRTARAPFIENLDDIPFPRRDLLDIDACHMHLPGRGTRRSTTVTASRGCPFQCVFCSARVILGDRLRTRSVENILCELDEIRNRLEIPHIYFNDSTLTLKREMILKLCEGIRRRGLDITWEGMTRVDMVDAELLCVMKKAGFVRFSFGIESGDQRVLDTIRKGITLDDIRNAFRLCREAGIATESFAMLGHPGETRASIRRTARFIRSIPEVCYSSFSIATPYPGTELERMATDNRHGLKLLTRDYERYRRYDGGVMEVNGLSPEALQREQKIGLLIMHSTPRKVLAVLRHFGAVTVFRKAVELLFSLFRRESR